MNSLNNEFKLYGIALTNFVDITPQGSVFRVYQLDIENTMKSFRPDRPDKEYKFEIRFYQTDKTTINFSKNVLGKYVAVRGNLISKKSETGNVYYALLGKEIYTPIGSKKELEAMNPLKLNNSK